MIVLSYDRLCSVSPDYLKLMKDLMNSFILSGSIEQDF